jgi:multiple sugar transport system ATP-binding protein
VEDAAESLALGALLERKPSQLSGGQRQRVALARAIVRRPQAFLMDEPLSNLDAKLRVQTRAELVELQRRLAATIIYVTHDQVEAMTMGHRIAVLDQGVLQQIGAPQDVYARPANLFVARFIGSPPMNTVAGTISRVDGELVVQLPGGTVPVPADVVPAVEASGATEVVIGVRPESLRFDLEAGIPATITVIESLGHERHVICRLADDQLVIVRQDAHEPAPAEASAARLRAEVGSMHVFDPETGARIGR